MEENLNSDDICFIDRKGGTVLLFGDYQYYKMRQYKNGSAVWRCANYKKLKCNGTFTINKENVILKHKNHQCPPNKAKNMIDKTLSNLKENVKTSDRPVPQLYNEAIANLEDSGINFVQTIPSLHNIQHGLYSARNKSIKCSKTVFTRLEEVQIPENCLSFVLADYAYEGSRILVFCSQKARELIPKINEYFTDATFKSSPKPFAELYNILGDVDSTSKHTKVVPLIFALLPDKREKTYITLFNLIRSQLPYFQPQKIHCDYELAAINAISAVFPQSKIIGCYYHWTRAIWRKAKSLKVTKNKAQKRIISLTAALPLLPSELISEGWTYITRESETCDIENFVDYVSRYWFKNDIVKFVSVFGQRHRTNNVVEGWHAKLNRSINKNTITLQRLLTILQKYDLEAITNLKYGINLKKRSTVSIENDNFILQIQMELLNDYINVGHALDKLR